MSDLEEMMMSDLRSRIEAEIADGKTGLIWTRGEGDDAEIGVTLSGVLIAQVLAGRVEVSGVAKLSGQSEEHVVGVVRSLNEKVSQLLVFLSDRRYPQCKRLES